MTSFRMLIPRTAAALVVAAGSTAVAPSLASAAQVPASDFTCGVTVFAGCNQTAQITTPTGTSAPDVGGPNPAAVGCPAYVGYDAPVITGTGRGEEHALYSADGLTNSSSRVFSGTATITAWIIDANGNLVSPDPAVPTYTGQYTETTAQTTTDGQYGTFNDTANFQGVDSSGDSFSYKQEVHATVPPGNTPIKFFQIASCG